MAKVISSTAAAVTVAGAGNTTIASISNLQGYLLCFHFNVATQNLDAFQVLVQAHPSATAIDLSPASWTALPSGGRFLYTNANLAAVAAAGNGYFEMDITGLTNVTVKASAAADSASVTPYWSVTQLL